MRLQEHQAQAVFNQTEDYVMFPDEATTSLCVWDSRNASRKQLLSLGHNGPVLEMPSCHMLNASSSQFHNHFKVKMNSILQPPHFSQRCAGWSTRPPMPPSSPAATTSEPDSGTGGTDLQGFLEKREQGDDDIYAHDMWALGFEEHFVHLR